MRLGERIAASVSVSSGPLPFPSDTVRALLVALLPPNVFLREFLSGHRRGTWGWAQCHGFITGCPPPPPLGSWGRTRERSLAGREEGDGRGHPTGRAALRRSQARPLASLKGPEPSENRAMKDQPG